MSFANHEVLTCIGGAFRPLIGRDPYNKKNVDDSLKGMDARMKVIEDHLMINTYLVGERLTLADIFVASILGRGFEHFFDKEWRSANPSVTRWYDTVTNQSIWTDVVPKFTYIEKAIENKPPKTEAKPKQEQPKKQEKAKKPADEEEEEEEDKPAPKPKHPLEALPKATFVLDDW
jgi:elongation factor 1-gamma